MSRFARAAVTVIAALTLAAAHAQGRPVPVNPPKLGPKVSSVTQNANTVIRFPGKTRTYGASLTYR